MGGAAILGGKVKASSSPSPSPSPSSSSSSVVVEEEQGHREEEEQESFLVNHSSFSHQYFEDEGCYIPHSSAGLVSMISNGVDENGSCFAITTAACPQVDGRFVCF